MTFLSCGCLMRLLEKVLPRNDVAEELQPYLRTQTTRPIEDNENALLSTVHRRDCDPTCQYPSSYGSSLYERVVNEENIVSEANLIPQRISLHQPESTTQKNQSFHNLARTRSPVPPIHQTNRPVFVAVSVAFLSSLKSMKEKDMEEVLSLYEHVIKSRFHDYGCAIVERGIIGDDFLLSFSSVEDAIKWSFVTQVTLLHAAWDKNFRLQYPYAHEEYYRNKPSSDPVLLFCGLRIKMGIHSGPLPTNNKSNDVNRSLASNLPDSDILLTKAIGRAAHGGQIIISETTWKLVKERLPHLGNPAMEDLGRHILVLSESNDVISTRLIQLLPKALGARVFPPLLSHIQTSLGMSDAPNPVTMVFTFIGDAGELVSQNVANAMQCIERYCNEARRLLHDCQGYECQELQGDFMAAFHSPVNAIVWCSLLQEFARNLKLEWNKSYEEVDPRDLGHLTISMGIEHGYPSDVLPHRISGCADYFGNIVNLTARIAKAARGGQILIGGDAWNRIALTFNNCSYDESASRNGFVCQHRSSIQLLSDDQFVQTSTCCNQSCPEPEPTLQYCRIDQPLQHRSCAVRCLWKGHFQLKGISSPTSLIQIIPYKHCEEEYPIIAASRVPASSSEPDPVNALAKVLWSTKNLNYIDSQNTIFIFQPCIIEEHDYLSRHTVRCRSKNNNSFKQARLYSTLMKFSHDKLDRIVNSKDVALPEDYAV